MVGWRLLAIALLSVAAWAAEAAGAKEVADSAATARALEDEEAMTCAAGMDQADCELSLRQLRAGQVEQQVAAHRAAESEALGDPSAEATQGPPVVERRGHCTADDEAIMAKLGGGNRQGSFPEAVARCGKSSAGWWSFNTNTMSSCLARKTGLSNECASCFSSAGRFGYDHCKVQCLFGSWCSNFCLGCSRAHDTETNACAGVPTPKVEQC
mmetsp:Transcript_107741/g.310220  ORF Transcript_107741/g.310220 Transcript_107741/m.310220 type:complete len:212 (-) Transcript_107741:24-659(-)